MAQHNIGIPKIRPCLIAKLHNSISGYVVAIFKYHPEYATHKKNALHPTVRIKNKILAQSQKYMLFQIFVKFCFNFIFSFFTTMQSVSFTPRAAVVISTRPSESFASPVMFPMLFSVFYCFFKSHNNANIQNLKLKTKLESWVMSTEV